MIPHVASHSSWQALNPEFSDTLCSLDLVPVRQYLSIPNLDQFLLMSVLFVLLESFLVILSLPFSNLLQILLSVLFDKSLMLQFFFLCFRWKVLRSKCHGLDPLRHFCVSSCYRYILEKVLEFLCE